MKNILFNPGIITAVITIILDLAFMTIIASLFKKKFFKDSTPNPAQAIAISGHLAASTILLAALINPLRDFITILSPEKTIHSTLFYSFIFTGCCVIATGYLLTAILETIIIKLVFRQTAQHIELQENNLAMGITKFTLSITLAGTFFLSIISTLQAFIPMPSIPTIR